MKKTLFCIILFFCFIVASWGQGRNIVATNPNVSVYTYVGSLMKDKSSGSNIEKIEVEVFGGDVSGGGLSTTSYRVATRNTYLVNKEIKGGPSSGSRHSFRVYENSNKLDLVIETFGWADFSIRAWIVDRNPVAHEVECINYDPTGKTDVTDQFQTTVYLASSGTDILALVKKTQLNALK